MEEYLQVAILKDDDGHTFLMPKDKAVDFYDDLEASYDDYAAKFNEKYGKYMLGGSLNSEPLYAKADYFSK